MLRWVQPFSAQALGKPVLRRNFRPFIVYSMRTATMAMMPPVLEIIGYITLLLVLLAGLLLLPLTTMRRFLAVRSRGNGPPRPPRREEHSARIDPWIESGRRMTVKADAPPESDSEDGFPSGGRFE